jgi:hypothetical protein
MSTVPVRLLVSMAGLDESWTPGEIVELDEATAERHVAAGHAELVQVVKEPVAEKATRETRETAVRPETTEVKPPPEPAKPKAKSRSRTATRKR